MTAWNDTFACYTTAKAVCEFQTTTKECGWTANAALTTCIAKPAKIATPKTYQNLTFPAAAPVTANVTLNISSVEFFNLTTQRFVCNCSNSRYPTSPLNNQSPNLR